MKINLARTDANTAAVNAALAAVNGRAEAFAITSWWEVAEIAREAEERLQAAGVPKAARKGVVVSHVPAGPSARAYKYDARSTEVTITRGSSGWYLTGVRPATVYPRSAPMTRTFISPDQWEIVVNHALEPFTVTAPAALAGVAA